MKKYILILFILLFSSISVYAWIIKYDNFRKVSLWINFQDLSYDNSILYIYRDDVNNNVCYIFNKNITCIRNWNVK